MDYFKIGTNISSLNTINSLNRASDVLSDAMTQLSTGKRIYDISSDASGLAISSRMNARVSGLEMAKKNANDAISMVETAESYLGSIHNMLGSMRDLAIQASNGTYSTDDLSKLNREYEHLTEEIGKIVDTADFNGINFFKNGLSVDFQVGANNGEVLTATFANLTSTVDSLANASLAHNDEARDAIKVIDEAISKISLERSNEGAYINRLEYSYDNLTTNKVNLSAARSRMEDADMAASASEMAKQTIAVQFGVAVLAQSNQNPQSVLKLLT